jgi:hypothetical protein
VIDWFLNLDKATQVALATSIVSSIVIGVIAVLGFWITYRTSTAAMQRSLRLSSKMKIAEFRMKWIDEFRVDLADLMKIQVETILIQQRENRLRDKGKSLAEETVEHKRDLNVESMMLRGRLLLRLKPNSTDPEESELESLLKTR